MARGASVRKSYPKGTAGVVIAREGAALSELILGPEPKRGQTPASDGEAGRSPGGTGPAETGGDQACPGKSRTS